jgi:hypothetical protein
MTDHLITPPPELVLIRPPHELVQQWVSLAGELEGFDPWQDLATQAARWGADQELEACCAWLEYDNPGGFWSNRLRAARRPKLLSLKEQALEALYQIESEFPAGSFGETIRRALEALPND